MTLEKNELLKYEIRKFRIESSKNSAKMKHEKLKNFEFFSVIISYMLNNDVLHSQLNELQQELDSIYEEKTKGAFIRFRLRWIEEGKKRNFV